MKKNVFILLCVVLCMFCFTAGVSAAEVWDGTASEYLQPVDPTQDYDKATNPMAVTSGQDLEYIRTVANQYNLADRYINYKVNGELKKSSVSALELSYRQTADILMNDETYTMDEASGIIIVSDGTHTGYLGTGIKGFRYNTNAAPEYGVWYTGASLNGVLVKDSSGYGGTLNAFRSIGWTFSGVNICMFKGNYDGGGYVIRGFYAVNDSASYAVAGLFGYAYSGEYKNIHMVDACSLPGPLGYAGLIFSRGQFPTVTDCSADGIIICNNPTQTGGIGGIGGYSASGTISRCSMRGFVGAVCKPNYTHYVGGIIGDFRNTSEDCYHIGNINAVGQSIYVGGITGYTGGTAKNCYHVGEITAYGDTRAYQIAKTATNSYFDNYAVNGTGNGTPKAASEITAALMGTGVWEDDAAGINYGYPVLKGQPVSGTAPVLQVPAPKKLIAFSAKIPKGVEYCYTLNTSGLFAYTGDGQVTVTCDKVYLNDGITVAANVTAETDAAGVTSVKVTPQSYDALCYVIPVTASDGEHSAAAEIVLNLNVNHPPVLAETGSPEPLTGTTGHNIVVDILGVFTDPDGDTLSYEWAISKDGGEYGDYSNTSDYNSFKVSEAGSYLLKFRVKDSAGEYAAEEYIVPVTVAQNQKPVRAGGVPATAAAKTPTGVAFELNLADIFTDPDNDRCSYKVKVDGAADFVNTSARYSYTGFEPGKHTLVFKANDGVEDSDVTYTVTLTVNKYGYNAEVWNGAVDISWYDEYLDEFTLTTPAQLAGLAAIVNGTAKITVNGTLTAVKDDFDGRVIRLGNDICLNDVSFSLDTGYGMVKISDGTNAFYQGTGMTGTVSGTTPQRGKYFNEKTDTAAVTISQTDAAAEWNGVRVLRWIPIGSSSGNSFKGTFDGKGYAVKGLFESTTNANVSYVGLFGYNGGMVENLAVDGYLCGGSYVAGIAAYSSGSVENCVNNAVVSGNQYAGGVCSMVNVPSNSSGASYTNLKNTAPVFGGNYIGGVAGYFFAMVNGVECSGLTNEGPVESYNTSSSVGGVIAFAGMNSNGNTLVIRECVNRGTVNLVCERRNPSAIGGICGLLQSNSGTLTLCDSYNTGGVYSSMAKAGGIAGNVAAGNGMGTRKVECRDCYNAGPVTVGQASFGSAIGQANVNTQISIENIWYSDITEPALTNTREGISAKPDAEMKEPAFAEVLGEAFAPDTEKKNNGYPVLAASTPADSKKDILSFSINGSEGSVDGKTVTVNHLAVDAGSAELTLTPEVTVSEGAKISPASGEAVVFTQDGEDWTLFTAAYKVTAANGSVRNYTVKVYTDARVASVAVEPGEVSVTEGFGSKTVKAVIAPVNAGNKNVTWSIADASVASVDENGVITGIKSGETTVTVTTVDGEKTAECKVTVKPFVSVSSVSLPGTLSLKKNDEAALTAVIEPENASNTNLIWSVDDASVASVDENGTVKGLKEGSAVVTVTTEDGAKTASCNVTVESIPVESVSVTKAEKLGVGMKKALTAAVSPASATVRGVEWSSSNPAVATVDENGIVSGVAAGTVTVTAVSADNSAISDSVELTVSKTPYDVHWQGIFNNGSNNMLAVSSLPTDPGKVSETWCNAVGNGSVAVVGDYVYTYAAAKGMDGYNIGGNPGSFYKIDRETGEIVKEVKDCPLIGGYYYGYTVYGGGMIYAAASNGVMAFDPDTCEILWTAGSGNGLYCCLQYVNGCVLCNGKVFDAVTGEKLLSLKGFYDYASGAVAGGYYCIPDYTGTIYVFDTADWSVVDKFEYKTAGSALQPGVAYDNGSLYWGDAMSSNIYKIDIDAATGALDKSSFIKTATNYTTVCTPVVYGNRVYLGGQGGNDGSINVYDADTLQLIYQAKGASQKIQSTPLLYHDAETGTNYVYAQEYGGGKIYILKDTPETVSGSLTVFASPSQANFAFEQLACDKDGALYVTNDCGVLFKFEKATAERPVIGKDLSTECVNIAKDSSIAALTVEASVQGEGTLTYQWQTSSNGNNWSDISGENGTSYTPQTDKEGMNYYRCSVTNTEQDGAVTVYSSAAQINVYSGGEKITVSFRLIGCTESDGDIDFDEEPGDFCGAEYVNWVKTKEYTIDNGSTAKDLIRIAFADAGIECTGLENNYISFVKAPEALGGTEMGEFTNGFYSGWMYTVNGVHPDAINLVTLKDKDVLIFHYVNDYRYEEGDNNPGGAYINLWLNAPDVNPGEEDENAEKAAAADSLIDAIGKVTEESGDAIKAAREAYDALTDEQKALVRNYDTLKAAEAVYAKIVSGLPFTDVEKGKWYYDAVAYVYNNGIMNGTGDGTTFEPGATLTRAMYVTMLYRLEGEPAVSGSCAFSDVKAGSWYEKAVIWASANGIVKGTSAVAFSPEAEISREQMAVMMYRYAEFAGKDITVKGDVSKFKDAAEISSWAGDAMVWANGSGIITGMDGNLLAPQASASRAEAATVFMRFMQAE